MSIVSPCFGCPHAAEREKNDSELLTIAYMSGGMDYKAEVERLNGVLREIVHNPGCRQLYMAAPMDSDNRPPTVAQFALRGMTKKSQNTTE